MAQFVINPDLLPVGSVSRMLRSTARSNGQNLAGGDQVVATSAGHCTASKTCAVLPVRERDRCRPPGPPVAVGLG
ncbi:hypothetical protein [Methylobacterium sp. WSM2598]|uniref:hypothetical protein n=1 Tax=Methylobacterium sp. WSM2598 TaxID=398261 RepID=UPI0012F6F9F7|nr:hypothetical protein [Methylobacterium sp. WSM2598]